MIDPDTFRSALGRFASGVTVITVCARDGRDHGMTVSAFASVSLEPPLVLACIGHDASMHDVMKKCEYFGVNVLSHAQEHLSRRFAAAESDRFDGIGFTRGEHGVALLDDALAHLECKVEARHEAGDHTIYVALVEQARVHTAQPLLYYRGGYATIER
jgi:flavin reductase (DIM6/NTAB) family NADH-FMN oxidoreductase RutF